MKIVRGFFKQKREKNDIYGLLFSVEGKSIKVFCLDEDKFVDKENLLEEAIKWFKEDNISNITIEEEENYFKKFKLEKI